MLGTARYRLRMRVALPSALWALLATPLLYGQAPPPPPPIPGEEVAPRAIPVKPTDPPAPKPKPVDPAPDADKPAVVPKPSDASGSTNVERLLKSSEGAQIKADTLWLEIEQSKLRNIISIDLTQSGMCHLIERVLSGEGRGETLFVRSGKTVSKSVRDQAFATTRNKAVIFGLGRDRIKLGTGSDRMRIGLASNLGRSVHTSRPAPFDDYPNGVRAAVTALLESAREMPVSTAARAVIRAEFVDPRQARRLTIVGGQKLVGVKDPGRDASVLPPVVAATRMPGRKMVISDELEWERVQAYLSAAGATDPKLGGQCLVGIGMQTYRLFVEPVTGRR